MAGSVKSGVFEFSDDQKVFVAVDEDDVVKKAVLIDREGNETALGALPTDEQVKEAVDAWLDDHPEATTTVEDGAVTTAKLANGAVTDDKIAADGIKAEVADLKTDLHYLFTEDIPFGESVTALYKDLPVYADGSYIKADGTIIPNTALTSSVLQIPTRGIKRIGIVATDDQSVYTSAYGVILNADGTVYQAVLFGSGMTTEGSEYYIEFDRMGFDYNSVLMLNWLGRNGDTYVMNDRINIEYYTKEEWTLNAPIKDEIADPIDIYLPALETYENGKYMKADGTLATNASSNVVAMSADFIDKIEVIFEAGHTTYPSNITPIAVLKDSNGQVASVLNPSTAGTWSLLIDHEHTTGGVLYVNIYDTNSWFHTWRSSGGSDIFTPYHIKAYRKTDDTSFKLKNYVKRPFVFNNKNIAYVGDSITRGVVDTDPITYTENTWAKLFSIAINASGYTVKAEAGARYYVPEGASGNTMLELLQAVTLSPTDIIFIAGGTNDWLLGSPLAEFKSAVDDLITYIKTNYANAKVIFITPINEAGWSGTPARANVGTMQDYRNIISEEVIENDNGNFSIIQGDSFNFPNSFGDSEYISAVFGDKLHPTELGYRTVYLTNLLQTLC